MPAPLPLPAFLRAFTEEALVLARLLATIEDAQWQPAPALQPRDDSGIRASGGQGDPTGEIAVDARRLAVRAAVVDAEVTLRSSLGELRRCVGTLDGAIGRWTGEGPATRAAA
ncbi:hypothetical protein [Rathayibacter sp. AY1E6]|uniref:DUF7169 domain-containing protein n=1 Tax=Rathayibacter sp. AY1E6 TaxID=2080554 RepID=UPI000CE79D71|nr:hypothetical protein [Rathayibacter sp. AY1E6]PPF72095.1 hypothetical protein C5C46_07410 [Rathayibacter sp. AY1E6]